MSKGAPDYTKMVSLKGRDADGNDVSVLVDSTGRMLAVIQGAVEVGGTLNTTVVNTTREVQGSDGTVLRTIALDTSGRIIAVIQGAVSVSGTMDTNVLNTVREIQGSDGATLKTLAVDSTGRLLAVMKGAYGAELQTIAVDAASRMIGTFTPIQDYVSFWAGTRARIVVNTVSIDFITILASGTLVVQRMLTARASGTAIGTVKIVYSGTFTYIKTIIGSGVLNEETIYLFSSTGTSPVITQTNSVLDLLILDYNNINHAKNAAVLTGTGAAYAVDENMDIWTGYTYTTSAEYVVIFAWDMGSLRTLRAYWTRFILWNSNGSGLSWAKLQYSENAADWIDLFEFMKAETGQSQTTKKERFGSSFQARYFRFIVKNDAPTNTTALQVGEIMFLE